VQRLAPTLGEHNEAILGSAAPQSSTTAGNGERD
jgi:hypothetical protein